MGDDTSKTEKLSVVGLGKLGPNPVVEVSSCAARLDTRYLVKISPSLRGPILHR